MDNFDSPVYYRIIAPRGRPLSVAQMQNFDEWDCDQERFLNRKRYETRAEAVAEMRRVAALVANGIDDADD